MVAVARAGHERPAPIGVRVRPGGMVALPQTAFVLKPLASDVPEAPKARRVHLTREPQGAEIEVDGVLLGRAPQDVTLPEDRDEFTLTARAPSCKPWSRSISSRYDEETLHITLDCAPGDEATQAAVADAGSEPSDRPDRPRARRPPLRLSGDPMDATITVNGVTRTRQFHDMVLPQTTLAIRVARPGYEPIEEQLVAGSIPSGTKRYRLSQLAQGCVQVGANGRVATIFIDGTPRGKTGVRRDKIEVPAGTHQIRLVYEVEGVAQEKSVEVEQGGACSVLNFDPPAPK